MLPEGVQEYVYGGFAPDAVADAVPLHVQPAFVELVLITNGVSGVFELFMELIHAAFAALFGEPGV